MKILSLLLILSISLNTVVAEDKSKDDVKLIELLELVKKNRTAQDNDCHSQEGVRVLHIVCSSEEAAETVFYLVRNTKVRKVQCSKHSEELSKKWGKAFEAWIERNQELINIAHKIKTKNSDAIFDQNALDVSYLLRVHNPSLDSCSEGYKELFASDSDVKNMKWLQGNLHYLGNEFNQSKQ